MGQLWMMKSLQASNREERVRARQNGCDAFKASLRAQSLLPSLSRSSRTTDSPAAAKSAVPRFCLVRRTAACALSRNPHKTAGVSSARSKELASSFAVSGRTSAALAL